MNDVASSPRFLAVWLPLLPSERLRRESPALPEAPLALTVRAGSAIRLAAVCARAAAAGLAPGIPLADARARVPGLQTAVHMPEQDAALLLALGEACDRYTPVVALVPPAALLLDISGAAHLCGGDAALAADLLARLTRLGLSARAALAANPAAALALAGFASPGRHGLVAQDAPIGGLPAAALTTPMLCIPGLELPDPGATATALRRAGLRSIADVLAQPRANLAARLGKPLVTRLDALTGHTPVPLSPLRPASPVRHLARFAQPILTTDAALRHLDALILLTCQTLSTRAEGGRTFIATLFRADSTLQRLTIRTSSPCRTPSTLMRLFTERLSTLSDPLDPGFGYDQLTLETPITTPLGTSQLDLEGGALSDTQFHALIDRLATRLGPSRIRRLAHLDTHIPEVAGHDRPFDTPQTPIPPLDRPLELFDPPQPVEVLAEIPDGPPRRFRNGPQIHHITHAEGPERLSHEWWRPQTPLTRDYYRLEDRHGARFWLFRHGLYTEKTSPGWYLHGRFA
jgi:protein ImuB